MADRIEISAQRISSSISDNSSKIEVTVKIISSLSWNNNKCSGSVIVDGTTHSFSHSFGTGTTTIYHATHTVKHDSDGTKTVKISARYETDTSLGTLTDSVSMVLSTIPRATKPELKVKEEFIGNNIVISMPRKSSGFYHTLRYKFKGKEETFKTKAGTTYTWPISRDLAKQVPDSNSGTCYIYCDTFNSEGKPIGTKYTSFVAKVGESFAPEITGVNVSEAVQKIRDSFNNFVQNESKMNVDIDARGLSGATIKSYSTTISGINYKSANFQTGFLKNPGNVWFKVKVKDSRGKTEEFRKEIKVLSYKKPKIFFISSVRCNPDGTLNDEGTNIKVRMSGYIDDLTKTSKTVKIEYKKITDNNYSTAPAGTYKTTKKGFEYSCIISNTVPDVAYQFKGTISDELNSDSKETQTGKIVMSRKAGGDGVCFFAEANKPGFWIKDLKIPFEKKSITGSGAVEPNGYKTLASIAIKKGTYLVSGYALWRTAFPENKLVSISLGGGGWTRLHHSASNSQGGTTLSGIVSVAGDNTIELKVRHGSSSTHTIVESSLDVVRIG